MRIAENVRLFNAAYQAAWDQVVESRMNRGGSAADLAAIIRALIKAGRADAAMIAAEALNHMRGVPPA